MNMNNENEIQTIVEYLSTYNPIMVECPDNMKTDKDVFIFTQWFSLINLPFQLDINNPIFLTQFDKYMIGVNCVVNIENDNIIIQQSQNQNKEWRQSQKWYRNGKHNECEYYQRNIIEKITKEPVALYPGASSAGESKPCPAKDVRRSFGTAAVHERYVSL